MAAALPPAPPPVIVVLGEPITPDVGALAFGQLTLGQDALEPVSGRVEDALREIGGLQLFRPATTRSANPTSEGLTTRGFAGNAASRIQVTLDGAPLADPFFGFISWGSMIGQPIESAKLTRGGGLGGPGALTGTLDLVSSVSSHAMVRYGSRNSFDGEASLAVPVSGGAIGISGGYSRGDGYVIVKHPGPVDIAAKYRQWSLAGTAKATVGSFDVTSRISGFNDHRLRGTEGADIVSSGGDFSLSARSTVGWHPRVLAYAMLRDFSTVTNPVNAARTAAPTTLNQLKTPGFGWGGELSIEPPLGDAAGLRLGAAWKAADGRTEEQFRYVAGVPTGGRLAGGTQQVVSGFADGSLRAGEAVLLTAEGRVDRWHQGVGRIQEFDLGTQNYTQNLWWDGRSNTETSGRIGALVMATPALRLRAAGYRSWRLPTLNELYRPYRVGADAIAANPDLKPEHLVGGEVSLGYQPVEAVDISVTGYWNRLSDPVANVTVASGPGTFPQVGFVSAAGTYKQRQNLNAIESHGLEGDVRLPLGPFRLRGSVALVDATVKGGALDGLRPSQAPKYSGSATLEWLHDGWEVSASVNHFGSRYEDDLNTKLLPAATTVDASFAVPIYDSTQLVFSAENLANALVVTGYSSTEYERGQPRTLWVGLRWQPGR